MGTFPLWLALLLASVFVLVVDVVVGITLKPGPLVTALSPDSRSVADWNFHLLTLLALSGAVFMWTFVALGDFRTAPNAQAIPASILFGLLFASVYAAYAVSMVGGRGSTVARPARVAFFLAASVAAHIGFFAYIYMLIDSVTHGSFGISRLSPIDAFYVATTTFTTVGSGTLSPINDEARAAVALESLLSIFMVAVGIALVLRRWALHGHS